jgi:hypothetical protein
VAEGSQESERSGDAETTKSLQPWYLNPLEPIFASWEILLHSVVDIPSRKYVTLLRSYSFLSI